MTSARFPPSSGDLPSLGYELSDMCLRRLDLSPVLELTVGAAMEASASSGTTSTSGVGVTCSARRWFLVACQRGKNKAITDAIDKHVDASRRRRSAVQIFPG